MKITFSFYKKMIEKDGYSVQEIHSVITRNFSARGLSCIADQDTLVVMDNGGLDDYANMWAIMMALLRTDWFLRFAVACVWRDDDGSEEDILSQAWKVRRQ